MTNRKDLPEALHRLSEAHRDNPFRTCVTCNKVVKVEWWDSQPVGTCPDCGNVIVTGVLQANYAQGIERTNSYPHNHYWEDGSSYSHSHVRGNIPHGHHGSKYGLPLKES